MNFDRNKQFNKTAVDISCYAQLRKPLYTWQLECLDRWFNNQGKGIVNVVTGAGKTILALGAIARLKKDLSEKNAPGLKIKIIVPKVFLAYQWAQCLQQDLAIANEDIGIYTGQHKDPPTRDYLIYVVNSARYTLTRHILHDLREGRPVLLIADECHRYSSPENSRIFDFISQLPVTAANVMYYALGLSATPETASSSAKLVPALGPEIFKYGFTEALNSRIISSFAVFNLKLSFTPDEKFEYLELTEKITRALDILMRRCAFLKGLDRLRFFASMETLAQNADEAEDASLARTVLILSNKRKDLVYKAESRVSCVKNLLAQLPASSKVLLFSERISVAETIFEQLQLVFPGQVGRYHSGMNARLRKEILRHYHEGQIRILVSCRALDEGLNVPSANIGIIASSSTSNRQRIQRLGRILRSSAEKNTAKLYYLYIGSSNEEQDLLAEITRGLSGVVPILEMSYDHERETFQHATYDALVDRVLEYNKSKKLSSAVMSELIRNLQRGKLSCDWWLSEQECRQQIRSAPTRSERNYWVAMLLIARAMLARI